MKKKEKLEKVNAIIDSIVKELNVAEVQYAPIKLEDIVFTRVENYDTTKLNCVEFRNKGDMRFGIELNLGNMIGGYPLIVNSQMFENSECAYIGGLYSSKGKDSEEIQRLLSTHKNGLFGKKTFRYRDNEYCKFKRQDWEDYNIEFMKYIILCKINTNEDFRNLLLFIPDNVMLIEDVSFMNGNNRLVWGCENNELKKIKKEKLKVLKQRLIEENIAYNKQFRQLLFNRIHNIGIWSGKNIMGKILTYFIVCMKNNIEPKIDFDLLRNMDIYWFGEKLNFD